MRRSKLLVTLFIMALALCSSGCSGGRSSSVSTVAADQSVPAPAAMPGLPQLSDFRDAMPESREVSYTNGDLFIQGFNFDAALPHNLAGTGGGQALLDPSWSPGDPASEIAFCIFNFHAEGYDLLPQLRFVSGGNIAEGDLWIALSNWDEGRWELFAPADGTVNFGSNEPYFDDSGNLLAAVVLLGNTPGSILYMRLGPYPPSAVLTADPTSGHVPLSVTLDASTSVIPEGEVTKYEWDVDGDGTFEIDTELVPTLDTQYSENGSYNSAVRVSSSVGLSDTASVEVEVVGYWQHLLGTDLYERFEGALALSDGSLVTYGDKEVPVKHSDLVLARWSATGELLWANSFDGSSDTEYFHCAAEDTDGNIILGGETKIGDDYQALVQSWSPTGTLNWSKRFGGTGTEEVESLLSIDGNVYACGGTTSMSATSDVFLTRLTGDGDLVWHRSRDRGSLDSADDMVPIASLALGTTGIAMICYSKGSVGNAWKLEYSLSGSYSDGKVLTPLDRDVSYLNLLRRVTIFSGEVTYYVSGRMFIDTEQAVFFSITDGNGNGEAMTVVELDEGLSVADMAYNITGSVLVAGNSDFNVGGKSDGALFDFSSITGNLLSFEYLSGLEDVTIHDLERFQSGLLIAGTSFDLDGIWNPAELTQTTLDSDFVEADGTGATPTWPMVNATGSTTDYAAIAAVDAEGEDGDGFIMYRALPGAP
jgi:PKD repeat protein